MIYKFEAMSIEITPVWNDCTGDYRYLYEEFDNNDFCIYSHYISKAQVAKFYPQALK